MGPQSQTQLTEQDRGICPHSLTEMSTQRKMFIEVPLLIWVTGRTPFYLWGEPRSTKSLWSMIVSRAAGSISRQALRASAQFLMVLFFCSDKLKWMFTESSPPRLQELMIAPSCWLASDTEHKRGKNLTRKKLEAVAISGCLLHSTLPAHWMLTDGDQKYQQVQQMCLEWPLGGWWGPSLQHS